MKTQNKVKSSYFKTCLNRVKNVGLLTGLILSLLVISSFAQDMPFSWGYGMGGKDKNAQYGDFSATKVSGSASDKDGNIFVVGTFQGEMNIENITLTSWKNGDYFQNNIFVVKHDRRGSVLWARSFGSEGSSEGNAIDVDEAGNVYLCGTLNGKIGFENGDTISAVKDSYNSYTGDIYIIKLKGDGSFIWANNIGGQGDEYGNFIKVDKHSNVYYAGHLWSTNPVDFNPSPDPKDTFFLRTTGDMDWTPDVFISKIDSAGNFVWAKSFGGESSEYLYGLAVDNDGNAVLSGAFSLKADFGGISLETGNNDMPWQGNAFLVRLDTIGDVLWAKKMGSSNTSSEGRGIATDEFGNIYHIGEINYESPVYPVDFGGDPIKSVFGSSDIVVTKLKDDGSKVWVRILGGKEEDKGNAIALDRSGGIYIAGSFSGTANFNVGSSGPYNIKSTGNGSNAYVCKMDNNGNFIWAKNVWAAATYPYVYTNTLHVDKSGNVVLGGEYNGTITLNPETGLMYSHFGDRSGFVIKYGCDATSLTELADSACGAYVYNDIEYTESGIYTQVFANTSGCDSTISLDLTIYNLEAEIIVKDDVELSTSEEFDTYQWLLNGEEIEEATGRDYEALENGDYQVVVSNAFGCSDTSKVQKVEALAINSAFLSSQIRIYPNPSAQFININSPVPVNVELTTIDGREILSMQDARTISLESLIDGMYLLRITDAKGSFLKVEKVIKRNK